MISFGPVPSRRLGKSLGINNIISPKTCSYGCVYCQVGKTMKKSITREVFFQPELIFEKVRQHLDQLSKENYPDYLTFVSNGEPTIDLNLGKSILLLKEPGFPVAVITNASLLFEKIILMPFILSYLSAIMFYYHKQHSNKFYIKLEKQISETG